MTRALPTTLLLLLLVPVLPTTGCGRPPARGAGPAAAAATPAPEPKPPAPPPLHGIAAGATVARAARDIPPVVQGRSGLLQAIPRVETRSPDRIEDTWLRIKRLGSVTRQFREIARRDLASQACDRLVDLRALEGEGLPPFRWRDRVRGRTWTRPTVAAVLIRAYRTLRSEYPRAFVSLGDLAQPGCGSLEHGTLVRVVEDDGRDRAATRLLNRARLVNGVPTVVERRPGADFLLEWERFEHPLEPVEVRHRLVAWDTDAGGDLRLRVETRRYRGHDTPDEGMTQALLEDVERAVSRGVQVRTRRVRSWTPEEGTVTRWLQHWVDRRERRQVILVSRERIGRRLDLDAVEEIRVAAWQRRKPGSFPGETRWRARRDDEVGQVAWTRALSLYEAGHISHLSGRDVDASYVTGDNVRHFAVDLEGIDVAATWAWFRALDAAARDLGVEIDRILVDPAVKRHMAESLPAEAKRTSLWRDRVRLAWGHDAHHHLRLEPAGEESEALARRILKALPTAVAGGVKEPSTSAALEPTSDEATTTATP
ncbi:MAG: penicillin-insensitive murein endopeptidase [Myxococcota bacterium]